MGLFSKIPVLNKVAKGAESLLFGTKDRGTQDRYADTRTKYDIKRDRLAREAESKAIGQYSGLMDEVSSPEAKEAFKQNLLFQQRQEEAQLLGAGRDAQMKARQLAAQRGLGRSAVGVRSELRADEPYRRGLASARTRLAGQMGEMERQRRIRSLNEIMSGIGAAGSNRSAGTTFVKGERGTGRSPGFVSTLFSGVAQGVGQRVGGAAASGAMGGGGGK